MCAGVSWGASEVCYFYLRSSFKGAFPHDYLKSSACTASVNLTRAEITGVIPADAARTSDQPDDPYCLWGSCSRGMTDRDCKCKVHNTLPARAPSWSHTVAHLAPEYTRRRITST